MYPYTYWGYHFEEKKPTALNLIALYVHLFQKLEFGLQYINFALHCMSASDTIHTQTYQLSNKFHFKSSYEMYEIAHSSFMVL